MERLGKTPIVDLTNASAKSRWVPSSGYGQLVVDSGNSDSLSWMNAAGVVVEIAIPEVEPFEELSVSSGEGEEEEEIVETTILPEEEEEEVVETPALPEEEVVVDEKPTPTEGEDPLPPEEEVIP